MEVQPGKVLEGLCETSKPSRGPDYIISLEGDRDRRYRRGAPGKGMKVNGREGGGCGGGFERSTCCPGGDRPSVVAYAHRLAHQRIHPRDHNRLLSFQFT